MEQRAAAKYLVAGVFVGLLALAVTAFLSRPDSKTSATSGSAADSNSLGGPPLGPSGAEVSISQAEQMSPVPVLRPQQPLASDSSIQQVWVRTTPAEVWIVYSSGIDVSVQPWTANVTPAQHWSGLQTVDGLTVDQSTVGSVAFYSQPPSSANPGGSVSFVTGETWVSVYGTGAQTESQLLDIANSAATSSSAAG
jgi:hypothetical protein